MPFPLVSVNTSPAMYGRICSSHAPRPWVPPSRMPVLVLMTRSSTRASVCEFPPIRVHCWVPNDCRVEQLVHPDVGGDVVDVVVLPIRRQDVRVDHDPLERLLGDPVRQPGGAH